MNLAKIVYFFLPDKLFSVLRKKFYLYRKKIFKPLSEEEIKDILINKMGVCKGKTVFIHSSMDFLNIDFSPNKLLNILVELVGEEGTLLFPAWHFNYRAKEYLEKDLVFDVQRSPSVMGLLSELARRNKSAFRSANPTSSIVSIGKHAKEIIEEHHDSIYPCGEKSPYYKMLKYDAIIIGLGVTTHFLSFVHCPEDVLKEKFPFKTREEDIYEGKIRDKDGLIAYVKTLVAHNDIKNRDMPKFFRKFISRDILNIFRIKGNDFYVADANALYQRIVELSEKNITIYSV